MQVNELTEYTHIHLFIYIYRDYLSICPPIVPFSNTSLPYSSVTAPLCVPLLLCLYILCPLSIWLPFLCYHVFYILCPLCLYVIMSSVPLLLCLLHTLSPMSLCHSGFISVKYFYHLTILSVSCECRVGQYLPFLSRTFREEFVTIKNTIIYKIKQRRQNSENHKFIYKRSTGKEVKERKNRCKKREFVYIFHNKG